MDHLDNRILNCLIENARMTASEISNRINLSVPAVSERIRKLENNGLIDHYSAILSAEKMGRNLTAIMLVSLERPRYNEGFVAHVVSEPDIIECHYLTGDFDYVLKIVTEGTGSLEKLLNRIKGVQGVQKTRTTVVLSTVKSGVTVVP